MNGKVRRVHRTGYRQLSVASSSDPAPVLRSSTKAGAGKHRNASWRYCQVCGHTLQTCVCPRAA